MLILALLLCLVLVVTVPVTTYVVAAGMFRANVVPSVEGTVVETMGITSGGREINSPCLSFSDFSNSYSVSFNISLSFKRISIISSSDF